MFFLRKPTYETVRKILASQANADLTYADVGATADPENLPSGYVIDHTRTKLGDGREVFEAAKAALKSWRQYAFSWLEAWPNDTPLEKGRDIATIARALGLWWVNICRIVDATDEANRFGYAYGTLPEHEEKGEERFLIEINEAGEVWYDILAFSRPGSWLAKIGYPYVRRVQKRFGRDSVAAMKREVENQVRGKSKGEPSH